MGIFDNAGKAPATRPDRLTANVVQLPTGGPADSKAINSTLNRVYKQYVDTDRKIDELYTKFAQYRAGLSQGANWRQAAAESLTLMRTRDQIEKQISHISTPTNDPAVYTQDFRLLREATHSLESVSNPGTYLTYDLSRRARIDANMGQVVLPYVDSASMFHAAKTDTTEEALFVDTDVLVQELTPTPAKEVTQTDPRYIYNAEPNRLWLLRAAYDLNSGVNEVVFAVTIQLPQQFATDANVLRLIPAPEGQLDVVNIKYSDTTSSPSILLPGATFPWQETTSTVHRFTPTQMASVTITLRSRRWTEESHHKVFYLGIQHLDLQLVEYDTSWDNNLAGSAQNNGFFDVMIPPTMEGILDGPLTLETINGIRTSPDYSDSIVGGVRTNNGIRILLSKAPEFTPGDIVWDSIGGTDPATTPVDVSAHGIDRLWVAVELDVLASGQTPVLERLEIDYKVSV